MSDSLTGLVEEQHAVRRRLLDHVRVRGIALRPRVGVLVVRALDQAGEVGLLVAGGGGGVVEGEESDGHARDGDEEAGLQGREWLAAEVSFTRARAVAAPVSSSKVLTYAEALRAAGGSGVGVVAGAVGGVTALNLGSRNARGAHCCSLEGLHGVCGGQWACVFACCSLSTCT